jgi:predicted N-acetyltransferase YhbS
VFDLITIPLDAYIATVMPETHAMWGGSLDLAEYGENYRAQATSGFGRRRLRTVGIRVDGAMVASCKRYARTFRCGERTFTAMGIGAVFTPPHVRGRGYATAMLAALLDAERANGTDFAYLFSDIRPEFYAELGFEKLPSRAIMMRADLLPSERVPVAVLDDLDEMRRSFAALESRREFGFVRTPLDWEWLKLLHVSRARYGQVVMLGTRRGRSLAAYVSGRRLPATDTFVLDELAFQRPADALSIAALLRAAAGDLRKITGWLPPEVARQALPGGAVRARKDAIAMILPLSAAFRTAWSSASGRVLRATSDAFWNADHI